MHRIGCEYLMPAVIIAFPFIKVYSWKKYTALRLWAVYFFVSLGGALGRAGAESIPRQCAEGGHAKKCVRRGLWRMVSNGQLFKNRTFLQLRGRDRAACAETGCLGDSQNELRCKNNGIGEETARRAQKLGVFGNRKTNYVVKTTELERKPCGGRGNGVFWGFTKRITL